MADIINHPPHYTQGKVETIDIIEQIIRSYDAEVGWSIGQTIKYLSRAPFKGNMLDDLKKAQWYLNRAVLVVGKASQSDGPSTKA